MFVKRALFLYDYNFTNNYYKIKKELTELGFTPNNIKGIQECYNIIDSISNGLSHIKALQFAKKLSYKNVLICESHTIFLKKKLLLKQIENFEKSNIEFDVLMLCGNVIPPYKRIGDFCIKVSQCLSSGCYIVNNHYYDILIENISDSIKLIMKNEGMKKICSFDNLWTNIQRLDNWYFITPSTVIQELKFSYSNYKNIDKNDYLLDIDKEKFITNMKKDIVVLVFGNMKNKHKIRYLIRTGYFKKLKMNGFIPFFVLSEKISDLDKDFTIYKDFIIINYKSNIKTPLSHTTEIYFNNVSFFSQYLYIYDIINYLYQDSIYGIIKHNSDNLLNIDKVDEIYEQLISVDYCYSENTGLWISSFYFNFINDSLKPDYKKIVREQINEYKENNTINSNNPKKKTLYKVTDIGDNNFDCILFSLLQEFKNTNEPNKIKLLEQKTFDTLFTTKRILQKNMGMQTNVVPITTMNKKISFRNILFNKLLNKKKVENKYRNKQNKNDREINSNYDGLKKDIDIF